MSRVVFTEELIDRFYQRISKEYPQYDKGTIDKICRAEFRMVKEQMTSGKLEDIRLQYLFKLTVSPQRVMKHLRLMYENKGKVSEERRQYYEKLLLTHIKNNKEKFKKYESRIRKYTGE